MEKFNTCKRLWEVSYMDAMKMTAIHIQEASFVIRKVKLTS